MGAGGEIKLNYFPRKRLAASGFTLRELPWVLATLSLYGDQLCGLFWPSHILYFQTRASWVALISRRVVVQQGARGYDVELGVPRPDFVQLLQPCWVSALSVELISCIERPTRFLTELLICDSCCLRTTLLFADNINHPTWRVVFSWLCKVSSERWTWRKLRQKLYRGLAFPVKINIFKILPSRRKRMLQNNLFAYNREPD